MPSPQKFQWIRQCRGINTGERCVLRFLVDEANGDGFVERLNARTIGYANGLSRRHVFGLLRTLQDKGFISDRTARVGVSGVRVSNSYQLDMERNHPPDVAGAGGTRSAQLGKLMCRMAADAAKAPEHYLEDSDAWFDPEHRVLVFWLASKAAGRFFHEHHLDLGSGIKSGARLLKSELPEAFEFLTPHGAWSTARPRKRGTKPEEIDQAG